MRLLAAATAVVGLAALAAPTTALAKEKHKKGHPSAVDVYVEQVQTASGSATAGASSSVPLSSSANRKLQSEGGKDAGILGRMATHPGYDQNLTAVGAASQPGTLDAAFDIGTGPAVLFAAVLATVVLVLVGAGVRRRRDS